jgi:hypothetical protein
MQYKPKEVSNVSKAQKPTEYKTKQSQKFEYKQSTEYRYSPPDLDRSESSIHSVFIAPSKGAKQNMDRLVKIKEKILNPGSDMSHDVNFSSITNGTIMKDSMATLSIDQGQDSPQDFLNASRSVSHEVEYLQNNRNNKYPKMNKDNKSKERFEYHEAKEEVYNPKLAESLSTTRPGIHNMVISEQLKAVIEENKKDKGDLNDYVNKNFDKNSIHEPTDSYDPNKNMINLENILIIEKKINEITDAINTMVEINLLCEDWWEVSQEETMLMNLGNVFKEPRYKAILKQATL